MTRGFGAGIEAAGRGAAAGIRRALLAAAGAPMAVRPEAGRFPPAPPFTRARKFSGPLSFRVSWGKRGAALRVAACRNARSGLFLAGSRLCSPFGLRVGAAGVLAKSTSYARQFAVNQGRRSSIEPATLVQWELIRYHLARELPDQRTPAGRGRQPFCGVVRVAGGHCRRQGARSRQPDGTGQPFQRRVVSRYRGIQDRLGVRACASTWPRTV